MTIPKRPLGHTGQEVTILGLGGEGVLRSHGLGAEAQAMIHAALDEGINYFESARAYAGSEAYLGKALKGRRDQIFLTSKSHGRTRAEAETHLAVTLQNLQTDYLDLWQVHDLRTFEEVAAIGGPGGALEAFLRAKEQGRVRFIGLTGHHDPEVLCRALQLYEFDTVLLPVNPAEPHQRSFLPLAEDVQARGMGVVGMKALCRGLLPSLQAGSVKDFVTYALSQAVHLVVVGADSVVQVRELAAVARDFQPMTPDDQRLLEQLVAPYARGLMYYKP